MIIMKFGGSSVGSPDRIKSVIEIVVKTAKNEGQVAVVVSAFQGVTDHLIDLAATAAKGEQYAEKLQLIEHLHLETVKQLINIHDQSSILAQVKIKLNELTDLCFGVSLIRELSPRVRDTIMSYGERLSAYIISEAFKNAGIEAEFLDARQVIKTNHDFGKAQVYLEESYANIQAYFSSHKTLQIITGFIGSTDSNETTTLGRGGSDYTASLFGAALKSDEIQIWTDVDGVLTADPRIVPEAFLLERITYEEAMELSHFGAKVIYPPTMHPALQDKIPIRILNTFNPECTGTLVSDKHIDNGYAITGLSSISKSVLLRVEGSGMVGIAGISARLFGSLARRQISVILITQGSSEHSICLAIEPDKAAEAKSCIEEEFALEIHAGHLAPVKVEPDLSIIAAVGENMRNMPGIAAKLFRALGMYGINIVAIAQGSSELNVSVVIDRSNEAKALKAIHESFFNPGLKKLHMFLIGTGLVGSELLKQISEQSDLLERQASVQICLNGVANSRKMSVSGNEINTDTWQKVLESSEESVDIEHFIEQAKLLRLPNSILVDCTAGNEVIGFYKSALESHISVVTPNKRANTQKHGFYQEIISASQSNGARYYYETTVGAALPVISTLKDLIRTGDTIYKVEGVLSGTLSYIFNSFDGTVPFSQVVLDAREKGYTEPDPREDLSGADVARKLLILAREAGYKLEIEDIAVENLVPLRCMQVASVDEFFDSLKAEDSHFQQLLGNAKAQNKVLRYIASLDSGKAQISLQAVGSEHPFYNLTGNDNIFAFTTKRYLHRPLVVKGPGAGAEVTASGVFADILKVARG